MKRPKDFCKDCWAEDDAAGTILRGQRPTPMAGPRCVTHHREVVKARKAAAHEKYVQATYGLAEGEYDRLYRLQSGVCAICKRATGATRKLSVDHDHSTGAVRGLLCRPCNDMLGHARNSDLFFYRAAGYLQLTPYQRMKGGFE